MQTALQLAESGTLPDGRVSATRRAAPKKRSVRAGTLAAIHITWKKLNPDLEGEDLRTARLTFITGALKLRAPLKSMRRLNDRQLGRVIDEMRRLESAPALPGVETGRRGDGATGRNGSPSPALPVSGSEVFHLATAAQVEAIDKLFVFLGWRPEGVEKFLERNFRRRTQRMLTPKEAQSCTYILLRIAASKSVKQSRQVERVSKVMLNEEIPKLKARLGIDIRPQRHGGTEDET
jgi:hypothetical protein